MNTIYNTIARLCNIKMLYKNICLFRNVNNYSKSLILYYVYVSYIKYIFCDEINSIISNSQRTRNSRVECDRGDPKYLSPT